MRAAPRFAGTLGVGDGETVGVTSRSGVGPVAGPAVALLVVGAYVINHFAGIDYPPLEPGPWLTRTRVVDLHAGRIRRSAGASAWRLSVLIATHHAYLYTELGRLDVLLDKVMAAHGARHVELDGIAATYRLLRDDLDPHLQKEGRMLFPMIRELATATEHPSFHCGSITNPISVMMAEHDRVGELLESLRLMTGDYTAPADGCASYRALFDGLAQLETDTHLHVHKENNLLFPAVVELEQRWAEPT